MSSRGLLDGLHDAVDGQALEVLAGDGRGDGAYLLGPHIVSCHAKDIILRDELTMHLSECPPGLGNLDWGVFVRELGRLDRDIPLMIEHLSDPEDCRAAAAYIRNVAQIEGVPVV